MSVSFEKMREEFEDWLIHNFAVDKKVLDHARGVDDVGVTGYTFDDSIFLAWEASRKYTKFPMGSRVRKIKGSRWQGRVVGTYSTELTPEGYAVESETEHGSVQIYPAHALELVSDK